MIKISNLNKYFYRKKSNEIHVLNDISIEFPSTGLVTIIGESGSGKTTLMNVLGGLDDFYSGDIVIDEFKLNKYSSKKMDRIRNEKIGYIFQNYLLLQNRTVYDNLLIVLNMYDLTTEEKNSRIDYVLESVGMLKYKKKNVSELSGGQQQRIAIARTLIKTPSLILADEPTGNLDEKNTIQIMNIIKKISEKTLVIMVSHERQIAVSYSDYLIEVCDGKVVKQSAITDNEIYTFEDDQNLYLKEYSYSNITNDFVNIDFYSNSDNKINLQVVCENGKFFIKSSDSIVVVDDSSEIKFIDEHKKVLDTSFESENIDYNLDPVKFTKTPSLSFKEQWNLAINNLNKSKKQSILLGIPLFIIIVIVLICIQGIISKSEVDRRHINLFDSRIHSINLEKQLPLMNRNVCQFGFQKFYEGFVSSNPGILPILDCSASFTFNLPNFSQLKDKKYTFNGFSVLPLECVSESDLIYGRMPQNANEIVIDEWVLQNAIEESTLANFMNVYSFLDKELSLLQNTTDKYKVVGISSNEENSVYLNKWVIFNVFPSNIKKSGISVCSISEAQKYVDRELTFDVTGYEFLGNVYSKRVDRLFTVELNDDKKLTLTKKANIDAGDCPFDIIVSDELYDQIFTSVLLTSYEQLNVFCKNEEEVNEVKNYINSVYDYFFSGTLKATSEFGYDESKPADIKDVKILVSYESNYINRITPYVLEAEKIVTSRLLVTFTIIIVSIIIVYFSMRSFTIKNINDIGVFRALGINKGSISFVYILEVLIISLFSTLIGGLLCYLVSNVIAGMPNYDPLIAISFNTFIIATGSLMLLNIIIGVLPVVLCLRKTPSQILSKYDI